MPSTFTKTVFPKIVTINIFEFPQSCDSTNATLSSLSEQLSRTAQRRTADNSDQFAVTACEYRAQRAKNRTEDFHVKIIHFHTLPFSIQ